jgi:hypothetical protein
MASRQLSYTSIPQGFISQNMPSVAHCNNSQHPKHTFTLTYLHHQELQTIYKSTCEILQSKHAIQLPFTKDMCH